MGDTRIEKVVIVGGGTAGWISAAAMARLLGKRFDITLIESDDIGTVGVGEATIPQIRRLNGVLGFDENDFVAKTKGTFKLGIEFNNWGRVGESYIHTFGDPGINLASTHFHQYWLRYAQNGGNADFWDFSLHKKAAYANKFDRVERVGNTSMGGLASALHFDAGLYAQYLRSFSEAQGVTRREGLIEDVRLDSETGDINSLQLRSGEVVEGDFFIDCSGFRGLLIGEALGVAYHDWSHWLPCDRAVAVPCESVEPLTPYTKATAHSAGWQWRIPLQHRIGNGHVFCSEFISEDEATDILLGNLDGAPLSDPRVLKFTTGRRADFWHKNCVAIGLASGFLEPLESTSIHLVQSNINRLIQLFPNNGINPANREEYNRQVAEEYEMIRDFLILHYHQTQRDDAPFWRHVRDMEVPESLRFKMDLFAEAGRIWHEPKDLFREASWVQVMLGQGIMPTDHAPMADQISDGQLDEFLTSVRTIVDRQVAALPSHQAFIDRHCAA